MHSHSFNVATFRQKLMAFSGSIFLFLPMHLHLTNLLNLFGVSVESFIDYGDFICFSLSILANEIVCPYCRKCTKELHQVRPIMVRDLPAFGKDVYLKLPRRQFYCRGCQRYITERLEFIDFRRKYTHRYEESIYIQVSKLSINLVSQEQRLSDREVKSILTSVDKKRKIH